MVPLSLSQPRASALGVEWTPAASALVFYADSFRFFLDLLDPDLHSLLCRWPFFTPRNSSPLALDPPCHVRGIFSFKTYVPALTYADEGGPGNFRGQPGFSIRGPRPTRWNPIF